MKRETTLDTVAEDSEVGALITAKWQAERKYHRLKDGVRSLLNEQMNRLEANAEHYDDEFSFHTKEFLKSRILVDLEKLIEGIDRSATTGRPDDPTDQP